MKALALTICLVCILYPAYAEDWPGFEHRAVFQEVRSASDDPKHATLFLKMDADDNRAHELALRYETDTKKVVSARWMTKGNFPLIIAVMGSFVPDLPKDPKTATVCLSEKQIKNLDNQKIAFLWLRWIDYAPENQ
jgi:hypothetical protein